jgi:hypothetical protein
MTQAVPQSYADEPILLRALDHRIINEFVDRKYLNRNGNGRRADPRSACPRGEMLTADVRARLR